MTVHTDRPAHVLSDPRLTHRPRLVRAPRIFDETFLLNATLRLMMGDRSDPCRLGHLVEPAVLEEVDCTGATRLQTAMCTRCLCSIDLTRKEL